MGFISDLAKSAQTTSTKDSQGHWREIFGNATHKEERSSSRSRLTHPSSTVTASQDNAIKRLLEMMRSRSPGGWTDDRWEQSKHFVGIAYVAIHRQNELLSQAEFQVMEKDDNHPDGERAARSPEAKGLIRLLERPNPEDNFGDLLTNWNLQQDLTGSAMTWVVPNRLGVPYEMYPIPTALCQPQPVLNPQFPDGYWRIQPVHPYGQFSSYSSPSTAVGAAIDAKWMMRFKYTHPLYRYDGYAPLTALKLHLDEIESMDRSRWYTMKKTFRPNVVLQMEEMEGATGLPEPEIERIRAEFEANFQGAENAGKLLVAPPGGRLEEFGTRPVDMDYQSGWDQLVSFALGGLGITKPAAGMVEDAAYANLFASLKQLYWLTLNPKVDRIAAKLTRFLAPYFGDNLIIKIRCKRIDDHELISSKIADGQRAKCIKKNEVRKMLDLPVTKEPWGEDIAGDPSPNEKAQQEQQQQQMGGGSPPPGGDVGTPDPGMVPITDVDPAEKERPTPGTLNQGSLGPRMKKLQVNGRRNLNGHHKRV